MRQKNGTLANTRLSFFLSSKKTRATMGDPDDPTPADAEEEEVPTSRLAKDERKAMDALTDNVRVCAGTGVQPIEQTAAGQSLDLLSTCSPSDLSPFLSPSKKQRAGPEAVDADKVKAAMAALQADMAATREAARQR